MNSEARYKGSVQGGRRCDEWGVSSAVRGRRFVRKRKMSEWKDKRESGVIFEVIARC